MKEVILFLAAFVLLTFNIDYSYCNYISSKQYEFENEYTLTNSSLSRVDLHKLKSNKTDYLGSNSSQKIPNVGLELDYRKDEFTICAFGQVQINFYRPVFEINTTLNTSKGNIWVSSSALYSTGYLIVAMVIVRSIKGEPVDKFVLDGPFDEEKNEWSENGLLSFIIFSPLFITNAEHHIFIINPVTTEGINRFGFSIFATIRTDIYDPGWVVYSPGYGIQLEFVRGKNEVGDYYNLVNLQVGSEYPYNFQLGDFQKPRLFAGLKFSF